MAAAAHLLGSALVVVPEGAVVAGALAVLQVGTIVGARRRPALAVVAFCALTAVQLVLALPRTGLGWLGLAYLLVRHGTPRAALVLATTMLAVLGVVTAAEAARSGDTPGEVLAFLATNLVFVGLQLLLAGTAGWARRSAEQRRRDREARDAEERREAALVEERRQIADDLASAVVHALARLADLAAGLRERLAEPAPGPAAALAEVQAEARHSLGAMRRVLTVLRAGEPSGTGLQASTAPPQRREPPPPTAGGLAMVLGAAAAIWLLDSVAVETGAPELDALLPFLAVDGGRPLVVLLLTVQLVGLGWWRTAPLTALAVATAGSIGMTLAGGTNLVAETGWMVLVYAAAAGAPALRSAMAVSAVTGVELGTSVLLDLPSPAGEAGPGDLAAAAVAVAAVWLLGTARRAARLHRERAAAERAALRTREAVEQERHRIARELHDVVAHHVSAVAVQAGAARAVADRDPGAVLAAADHIEEYGRRIRQVLPELVGLSPPSAILPLTPDGVDRLLAPLRAAGLPVTADVRGEPGGGAGDTDLFAQRILVEALTNVFRHAGRSATRVVVEHGADLLSVDVTDSGPAEPAGPGDGAGLGLVGMRERAALLGGELSAGPTAAGGWSVSARLPRAGPLLPEEEEAPKDRSSRRRAGTVPTPSVAQPDRRAAGARGERKQR